ncbi:RAxF-45 family protein [Paenibacillus yanchengensis]
MNGFWNTFLMFNRSKFAVAMVNGISVSFFNNCIVNIKR